MFLYNLKIIFLLKDVFTLKSIGTNWIGFTDKMKIYKFLYNSRINRDTKNWASQFFLKLSGNIFEIYRNNKLLCCVRGLTCAWTIILQK